MCRPLACVGPTIHPKIDQEHGMNTIDGDKPVGKPARADRVSNRPKAGIGSFDKVFQAVVASPAVRQPDLQPSAMVATIRPAQFETKGGFSADRVVERVSRLIDTLDVYRQQLSEKGVSMKDLQAFVADMRSQNEALQSLSGKIDPGDDLHAIVDQSLMLSSMEIARFNGGHYNESS
jgi:hypothetical protein